jgi:hypothetical protein
MGTIFRDARLKIERADKHIRDLKDAIALLKQSERATVEVNLNTGYQELIHTLEFPSKITDDIALIAGDAIHNLKSALDFAWQCTLKKFPTVGVSDQSKFPVYRTQEDLINALNGINVSPRSNPSLYRAIVTDIQPYEGFKYGAALYVLHKLDITDKHLLPLGLLPLAAVEHIVVQKDDGEVIHGYGVTTEAPPPYVIPFERNVYIKDKGQLAFDVVLPNSGVYELVEITAVLSKLSRVTVYCIELLEDL